MILRLSDSLSRGLVVVAALLIAVWMSFFSLRAALALHCAEGQADKDLLSATHLEPENFLYWYILGRYQQYSLEQPNAALAEESYKKAIALNPYATDAWLDLATAYELDGDSAKAREAYLQAKKSYPTSADVSWRYGNFLLRQGEQAQAYAELRRAIAADPHRAAAAFSRAYRTNPNIDQLLAELLPAQQDVYVDVISEALSAQQLAVAKTVWAQLTKMNPQLEIRDVDRFVDQLLYAGEFSQARQVWDQGTATMRLPPLLQPKSSVVWDPSFETALNGHPFSWHYPSILQGVSIGLDVAQKLSGNQSLRLSFDGKHDPNLEAACAMVIVQPGTSYRFSGWVKTNALTSDQGVGFRIRSLDGGTAGQTVNTRRIQGTNPWVFVDETWTSVPGNHRAQVCVVRDASDNSDARISGTAWIDDVNLLPEPAEHHKP